MIIHRDIYINQLSDLMNNSRVKIITGIRRCGKSYLLRELFSEYLLAKGVKKNHIIYLALDDMSNNHLLNPLSLDSYIRNLIKDDEKYYVILDEIQRVFPIVNPIFTEGKIVKTKVEDDNAITFVNVVLGLMQINNVDLYITGSNSKFLSKDVMTEFRDRGDEIHVQPLSFSEYVGALKPSNVDYALNEYMLYGGMPLVLSFRSDERKKEYLKNLFKLTYHKDVIERNNIRKSKELETLTEILASNVGSLINPKKISDTFLSVEKTKIDSDTINSWLIYLNDAFIIEKVNRFDIRGRKHIGALYKYYFADSGLRNARLNFLHRDDGHVMENIIFNELKHRGFSVQVGVVEVYSKDNEGVTQRFSLETDFVASLGSKYYYIQSAYRMSSETKINQERKSLINIEDSFKKIIVSRDSSPIRRDENGIMYIGLEQFLLDKNSLDL